MACAKPLVQYVDNGGGCHLEACNAGHSNKKLEYVLGASLDVGAGHDVRVFGSGIASDIELIKLGTVNLTRDAKLRMA